MKFENIKFVVTGVLISTLVAIVCVHLGNWQYNKAQLKQQYQATLEQRLKATAVPLPTDFSQPESLRYLRVKVQGEYLAQAQFLWDNQVYQDQAGYNVITPFRIQASQQVVLVNRGWIVKDFTSSQLPNVAVPNGLQEVEGYLWVPPSKTYQLPNAVAANQSQTTAVQETLDIPAIAKQLNLPVAPVVMRLIQAEQGSGLLVDWPRPDDRIATHLSYAYQWYGFAFAAVIIFLVVAWRRSWK